MAFSTPSTRQLASMGVPTLQEASRPVSLRCDEFHTQIATASDVLIHLRSPLAPPSSKFQPQEQSQPLSVQSASESPSHPSIRSLETQPTRSELESLTRSDADRLESPNLRRAQNDSQLSSGALNTPPPPPSPSSQPPYDALPTRRSPILRSFQETFSSQRPETIPEILPYCDSITFARKAVELTSKILAEVGSGSIRDAYCLEVIPGQDGWAFLFQFPPVIW